MRVLHVAQPGCGGVGRMVSGVANEQQAGGRLVPYVAAQADSELASHLRSDVRLIPWDAVREPTRGVLHEIDSLRAIVDRVRPDVTHLHSSKAGLVGRLLLRGGVPTVFQPHGWSWLAVTGAQRVAAVRWERTALRWTSRVICVSRDEAALGRSHRIGPRSVTVVPNGVDPTVFRPRDRTACRRELGLQDVPTVVMVGRLSGEKGADLLLDSWPRVTARVPDARLVVVGDGVERSALAERAAALGSVRLVGWQPRPELWYAAADVVVLPSRREAMALAPLEAMASARPVVGFDVDGFRECLGDSAASAVAAPGDVRALADRTIARLSDAALARREGGLHRGAVVARFDLGHVTEGIESVYSAVVGERPGPAAAGDRPRRRGVRG